MRICYHGTTEANAKAILSEGFRDGTWFAANLQDALGYGGLHVFEVVFDEVPAWQFTSNPVSTGRIVRYTVYTADVLLDNQELRKRVFDYNLRGQK
jgi:hypothetical protein